MRRVEAFLPPDSVEHPGLRTRLTGHGAAADNNVVEVPVIPFRLGRALTFALFCVCGLVALTPLTAQEEGLILRTSAGTVTIRLLEEEAPVHVAKVKELAQSGFYDGTTFHRVLAGFLVQGGDPASRDADPSNDGNGDPGFRLDAEIGRMRHLRGRVGAARRVDVARLRQNRPERESFLNSANSQFYILVGDAPHMDGRFTIFGEVVFGMDVVDRISEVPRDAWDRPLTPVWIESARLTSDAASALEPVVIEQRQVNVRSGPGTDHFIVEKVTRGTRVERLGEDSGWIEVRLPSGAVGWVRMDMVGPVR